ncbi:unnamed protein product [Oncorhynchus mykiss]|uniref:Uncharacterized protein n=1 Tax=Oncorhynchus mykiss TaxID=8022 RepID=A0A060YPX7_ONCMY|nr:unnamed protein product [Oncorhynchus mykiss]
MCGFAVEWWRSCCRTTIRRSLVTHTATTMQRPVTCPNASFTDLAEIASRIELAKPALVDEQSDYPTD